MKKHILPGLLAGALMAMAPTVQSNAQIKNDRGTFNMPGTGDLLIETQANLNLTGGRVFNLNDGFLVNLNNGLNTAAVVGVGYTSHNYFPMLKARLFMKNNWAMRVQLNASFSADKMSDSVTDFTVKNSGAALTWGMEKIFTPAERLNTYVGADVTVGYARLSSETSASNIEINQTAIGFGLRAFTGMDYYVLPKVYLGLELGYGLGFSRYGEVNYDNGDNGETNTDFAITPYVTPTFRLGYVLGCGGGRKKHGHHEPSYRSKERYDEDDE